MTFQNTSSQESDESTIPSVNSTPMEKKTLAFRQFSQSETHIVQRSPTKYRKYEEISEVVEESDWETTQISHSLAQGVEEAQEVRVTSSCRQSSQTTNGQISSSLHSVQKNTISRLKRSAHEEFDEPAYATPSRRTVGDCISEIITPSAEIRSASLETATPQTMPKSMRKDARALLGDTRKEDAAGCWCATPTFDRCRDHWHDGALDCELPLSFECTAEQAVNVQYLIPPLRVGPSPAPGVHSRVFENTHGRPVLTLVLDLDETLIFNRQTSWKSHNEPILRSFLIPFLLSLPRHLVEVVVWTASTAATARHVIRHIFAQVRRLLASGGASSSVSPTETGENRVGIIDHVISRNSFWFLSPYPEGTESVEIPRTPISYHTKDLRLIGRNLDHVLLVENSYHCCKLQPKNSVLVKDFLGLSRMPMNITRAVQHEAHEPPLEDLIHEYLCFQSLVRSYEDGNTQKEAIQHCGEHCMKPLHEHHQDMTLVGLSVLIRETVRRLSTENGPTTVPNVLHELSEENFPLQATPTGRANGNESFFMNFLRMETFPFAEMEKTDDTSEKRYFQSLNARINSPISGKFFHVQKELFGEPQGRHTV